MQKEIQQRRFAIAVDYAHGSTVDVLDPLLEHLIVDVVGLNARPEAQLLASSPKEWEESLNMLGKLTAAMGRDMGAKLDVSGEKLYLVDESGIRIEDIVAGAIMAELLWRRQPGGIIVVQVDCPTLFEEMAEAHQGRVIRTKVAMQSLMAIAEEEDILAALDCSGSFIFPQLHPAPDAMFALAKLLELLAVEKTTLHQIVTGLPPFYWMRTTLPCPWDAKGRVMREVNEGVGPYIIDAIDGVRFSAGDGRWALIRPDADRPLLHVVAQGRSEKDAAELLHQQVAWVKQIVAMD
jgi:mannose-1-phosphate guanylyltransferase/phosphomannomutase